jgi:hypothetical protein
MKRLVLLFLTIFAVLAVVAAPAPPAVFAQSTTDYIEEGGYRLPRNHQYQIYDGKSATYSNVDAASVPGRLAAGTPVYDRTAEMWVFHPSVGGKNPAYAAGAPPVPTASSPGTQGGWQRVHGTVLSKSGSSMQFKTDDGHTLTVDMSTVGANVQQALTPNETATIIGKAGTQANQFVANYVQQDSSDPARGGKVVGQAAAPAASTAQPSAAAKPADDKSWQRIHGTVASNSGTTLSLKTGDGQTLSVDTSKVDAGVRNNVKAGETVTVIGHYKSADKKNLEAQFIQKDSSAGSASPKTTK